MIIEEVNIESIIPYEKNNKIHDITQIDRIANSIREFWFIQPLVVDQNNILIIWHGRLEASKKLWLKTVPVLKKEDLTDKQIKKLRILDNKLNESERDIENLKLELEDLGDLNIWELELSIEELFPEIKDEEEPEIKETEVWQVRPAKIVRGGDSFILWEHHLLCWDSTNEEDVWKLMDGEFVDMVFTDPPYWVSYTEKNEYLNRIGKPLSVSDAIQNDSKTPEEMQEFREKAFANLHKYSKDCMSYYITAPQWWDLLLLLTSIRNCGFALKHQMVRNKNNHVLWRCDYNYKHEPIIYGWKLDGTHKFYWKGEFHTSVRDIPKPNNSDLHPTMKPVRLVVNCILNNTLKWDSVLDLFGGSWTTLIACEQTGRKCYMMEYEPKYIETIIRRFHELNPKAEIKCLNRDIDIKEILTD